MKIGPTVGLVDNGLIAGGSPAIWLLDSTRFSRYAARMTLAKKLLHTRYRVNDLERTVKFYREVLGLEEVRRHKSPRAGARPFANAS